MRTTSHTHTHMYIYKNGSHAKFSEREHQKQK